MEVQYTCIYKKLNILITNHIGFNLQTLEMIDQYLFYGRMYYLVVIFTKQPLSNFLSSLKTSSVRSLPKELQRFAAGGHYPDYLSKNICKSNVHRRCLC